SCSLGGPSRIVGRATLGLCALVLLALPATSGADRVGRLRADRAALASKEHAALLQLYSLDTSLDQARGRLASLESTLADARRGRNTARRQLRAAQRTLAIAQRSLAAQLRALYERDNPDVLAVLFGASTLDDIITGIDNVNRTAT